MTPEEKLIKAAEIGRCLNDEVMPQIMVNWPQFDEGEVASLLIGWGFSILFSNKDKENISKSVNSINDMIERFEDKNE